MPKWKKDAKEFAVSVSYNERRGDQVYLPKPIVDKLGSPEKIVFVIEGRKIEIKPS